MKNDPMDGSQGRLTTEEETGSEHGLPPNLLDPLGRLPGSSVKLPLTLPTIPPTTAAVPAKGYRCNLLTCPEAFTTGPQTASNQAGTHATCGRKGWDPKLLCGLGVRITLGSFVQTENTSAHTHQTSQLRKRECRMVL